MRGFVGMILLTAWLTLLCGCGELERVYVPPGQGEPMRGSTWWGSDAVCSPGCPPGYGGSW